MFISNVNKKKKRFILTFHHLEKNLLFMVLNIKF